ncbi:hypothetical protein [Leeia oryzae]|uniref:hypothetical protein n=1 Tax=Leeia oryzae TaxID=356662 RepID=UPI000382E81B|nr:hypothetical protein [Leeia oryzae]
MSSRQVLLRLGASALVGFAGLEMIAMYRGVHLGSDYPRSLCMGHPACLHMDSYTEVPNLFNGKVIQYRLTLDTSKLSPAERAALPDFQEALDAFPVSNNEAFWAHLTGSSMHGTIVLKDPPPVSVVPASPRPRHTGKGKHRLSTSGVRM